MKIMITRRTSQQRGQALAEMGLVVVLFVGLTLGIIDFGRMLMIGNMVSHAARDGARQAALTRSEDWATDLATLQTNVQNQIRNVTATTYTVTRSCQVVNGKPRVSVLVSGVEPYMFGFIWSSDVTINRTASFRYEGLETVCP